jgi:CopG family transcriptional regulator/antitoxin EndoAI
MGRRFLDGEKEKGPFLTQAVDCYIKQIGRVNLRKLLKEGALRRAKRDRILANDCFVLEEEESDASRK